MNHQVYKTIELTGTSPTSIEDAVNLALHRAGETIHHLCWFEVIETRGCIENNQVKSWQVTLKIGFGVDEVAK